ncbi:MAG: hypothetical protein KDI87_04345 [Gammaproteobacteria bacterium]|nr:hypothetical protein [Gammaproteobacteria bacterium]MCP5139640.1 hypothetical protein [Chromatiales bacterium]
MTDHKSQSLSSRYPELHDGKSGGTHNRMSPQTDHRSPGLVAQNGKEVTNWDAYRRWLSRVQLPDKRRTAMDPSLYTWKGYRSWADKVRRDWTPEEK